MAYSLGMSVAEADQFLQLAEEQLDGRRVAEALLTFEAAERAGADPDHCSGGRWICLMLLGRYPEAWCESDRIAERGKPDANRFWDGKPLTSRRVIVRCLHGLGDTLQFARFLPRLREVSSELIFEVQPDLYSLFQESLRHDDLGVDRLTTWSEKYSEWDTQVEVNELARILRVTREEARPEAPYIHVSGRSRHVSGASQIASAVRGWQDELRVGLVWEAGRFNPARSVGADRVQSLFDLPRVRYFSLQGGETNGCSLPPRCEITRVCTESTSILDLARHMQGMDVILSVDTMAAHLAGAMGLPVWTLLPFAADWRWMLERRDSPWYPTMRLYRQSAPGDWEGVLRQVRADLSRLADHRQRQQLSEG